jgi:hypothetical protein
MIADAESEEPATSTSVTRALSGRLKPIFRQIDAYAERWRAQPFTTIPCSRDGFP